MPPRDTARRRDTAFAAAACAALLAHNNLAGLHPWHARWYVPLNAAATAATLAAAAAAGLTPADLGLTRVPSGRLAFLPPAAVAAGWLAIAAIPAARPVLGDKRVEGLDGRGVAYQVVVRIPVGTVLWEEVAFRGVLQAAFRRVMSERAAMAATSAAFGLWHIRPTLQALRVNGLAGDRRLAAGRTAAVVALTAAAGVVLSGLRARSGSLAPPVLLHLAASSGGLIAAWWCLTRDDHASRR